MTFCFRHNINCVYLPAHTSHGLQALDNAPFSVLKGAYEREIETLNSFTDSSPIGKINFIKCLAKARKAVDSRTIRKGFSHTGTWPVNRSKALRNPEIRPDTVENAPEDVIPSDAESESEKLVTRDFVMSLADSRDPRSARDRKNSAKLAADELVDLRSQITLFKHQNRGLEHRVSELLKTKKKRRLPPNLTRTRSSRRHRNPQQRSYNRISTE